MDNFYSNEISEYNENYNDAISKIDSINNVLDSLYSSFIGASGNDIDNIRKDITNLKNKLFQIKNLIESKKNITNQRAINCDKCFKYYKNKNYSAVTKGKYRYEAYAEVGINMENGLIKIRRFYTRTKSVWNTIWEIFEQAGEDGFTDSDISKEEMFNFK